MVDDIAKMFLNFSHDTMIIPIVIFGYIWISRSVFYDAVVLLLLSMIYNFILKQYFQVPLGMHLYKVGFAFPSGHMQSSFVLYGWIAFMMRNWFVRILLALLIGGIAVSLVKLEYHNYYDILGAIIFGLVLMIWYYYVSKNYRSYLHWIVIGFATLMIIYIITLQQHIVPEHLWLAYYALIGFSLSDKMWGKKIIFNGVLSKTLSTIIYFAALFLMRNIFEMPEIKSMPDYIYQMQWLVVGFSIPFSNVVANKMIDLLAIRNVD